MKKVYISYSTIDKPFVSWLVKELKNENIEVWYDELELNAGDLIKEKILEGIKASSLFFIILSKASLNSKWVNYELNQALIYSAQKNGIKIIPLLIEDEVTIPSNLNSIMYADFRFNRESALAKLIHEIQSTKDKLVYIPSWESITHNDFENIVFNLLHKIGLKDIIRNTGSRDHSFDFIGYFNSLDKSKKEKWIVEAKFYKNSKVTVNTIVNLYGAAKLTLSDSILIITNSSLTNSAFNFINENIKDINVHIWDELYLSDLITKYTDIQEQYFKIENIVEDKIVNIYDKKLTKTQDCINKLKNCPEGNNGWKEYENICIEILNYLFVPPLKEPKIQSRTESGLDIRDAIYPNRGNHQNWGFIRNDYDAKYLIFEFKNYSTTEEGALIDKHVVNQVRNYLKNTIGRIGFVCSKKQPCNSAIEARKQAFIEDKKLILFLNNENLIDMLMKKYRNEEPSDVIVDMIDEFNINFG